MFLCNTAVSFQQSAFSKKNRKMRLSPTLMARLQVEQVMLLADSLLLTAERFLLFFRRVQDTTALRALQDFFIFPYLDIKLRWDIHVTA